ncbi:MAG: hypothetical protein HYT94_05180 [Parcubacteria group bacterium]|nr:hypothetical protein [Parcubacteria group bacterium]
MNKYLLIAYNGGAYLFEEKGDEEAARVAVSYLEEHGYAELSLLARITGGLQVDLKIYLHASRLRRANTEKSAGICCTSGKP